MVSEDENKIYVNSQISKRLQPKAESDYGSDSDGESECGQSKMESFLTSEGDMFRRLNIDKTPEMSISEWWLIYLFVFLIIISAGTRLGIILYDSLETQSKREDFFDTLYILYFGNKASFEDKSETVLKNLHILYATGGAHICLPVLFILGIIPEKLFSLMVQMVLSIITLVITILQAEVLDQLKEFYGDKDCTRRKSCNHKNVAGGLLYGIVIVFTLTTIIRCIFRTRVKQWIVGIRCLGPQIDFFASRHMRDFLALVLMLFLAFTLMSGIILYTNEKYKEYKDEDLVPKWDLALEMTSSCTTVFMLILSIWIYAQVHHRFTHTRRVEEAVLMAELEKLGEEHQKSIVDYDRQRIARSGYSPHTGEAEFPVRSSHLAEVEENHEEEDVPA